MAKALVEQTVSKEIERFRSLWSGGISHDDGLDRLLSAQALAEIDRLDRAQLARDLPVAVVGAGFSGTLLTINLLRQRSRVILVERDAHKLAKGVAFGTLRPEHLLNVRAANMSAFPDDKDHFLRWLGFSGEDQANRFVPRLPMDIICTSN
jgi:hypothetical protein